MAHGWDSYFANIPPVSSDPSTLRRLSESEGSVSPHLENFIGHDDFTTGSSHETHATNSNFQTSFYSNPCVGASRSDCVYQKYYKDTPWQTEGEHMEKDNDISEFATDGLSTTGAFPSSFSTNLHELKQDCGMLASSFLGDYSDVSSCSEADVSETRPSCKFMTSNSVPNSTNDVDIKQSPSEWLFTPTGNMTISTESQCCNARLLLPSNVKAGETMGECTHGKMEKSIGSCTKRQTSETLNLTTARGSESVEDCDGYQEEDAEVEQFVTEEKNADTPISILTSNETQEFPGSTMEEQNTLISSNTVTFDSLDQDNLNGKTRGNEKGKCGDQEDMGLDKQKITTSTNYQDIKKEDEAKEKILNGKIKELSKQNDDVLQNQNASSQHDQDENMGEENQDKVIQSHRLQSAAVQGLGLSDSTDPTDKLGTCTSPLEGNSQDVELSLDMPENQSLELKTQDNMCGSIAVNGDGNDVNTNGSNEQSPLESYLQSNCSSTDGNLCLEKQSTIPAVKTKISSPNPDCNSLAVSSVSQCIDKSDNSRHVPINLQSCLQGNGLSKNIVSLEKERTSQIEKAYKTFSSDQDCSGLVMVSASDDNKQSVCSHSELCVQENSSSTCLEKQLTREEKTNTGTFQDQDCSSYAVSSLIESIDNSDNKEQSDSTHLESCLQPNIPEARLNVSPEKGCSVEAEKTDTVSSKQDCSDSFVTCDSNLISSDDNNEKNICNHPEFCSLQKTDMDPCLEAQTERSNATTFQDPDGSSPNLSQHIDASDKREPNVPSHLESKTQNSLRTCLNFSQQKDISNSALKTNTTSSNRDCSSTVLTDAGQYIAASDNNKQSICTHIESSLLAQTNECTPRPEKPKMVTSQDPNCSSPGVSQCIDNNGNNEQSVSAHSECCEPLNTLEINRNIPVEMECRSPAEETDIALSDLNCSETAMISHDHTTAADECNEHHASFPVESSVHSDIPRMDTNPSPEKEWTNSSERTNTPCPYKDQSLQQSPAAIIPEHFNGVSENTKEPFRDLDTAKECSVEGRPYGETLSEENSCDNGETEFKSQCEEISLIRHDSDGVHHSKRVPELKFSVRMRKCLQPIVMLDTLKPVHVTSSLYHCAQCQHTASSINGLIDHLCSSHFVHNFIFCQTCNTFLMKNQHTEKHVCGASESPQDSESDLQNKPKPDIRSKCPRCGLVFSEFDSYVKHMWTHSGWTRYKCKGCGLYFSKKCGLTKHERTPGRCKRPDSKDKDATPAARTSEVKAPPRMDLVQNGPYASLPECYVKLVDLLKSNVCVCCDKTFLTVERTKKHFYNVHKEKKGTFVLNQCTQKVAVENYPEVDTGSRGTYNCVLCERVFKYSYNRARHLRDCVRNAIWGGREKVGKKFQCPLCKAMFTLKSSRYRHLHKVCLKRCLMQLAKERAAALKSDTEKKPFKNEQAKPCGKKAKMQLKGTVRRKAPSPITAHQLAPQHESSLCPPVIKHSSGKSRPMRISDSSSVPVPEAEECTDNVTSAETNSSLPFSCRFCGERFDLPLSLEKHEYTHKGERPYRCLTCNKDFKARRHLIVHESTHQRRIQCTVCKKILPTIGELLQHRNKHLKKGMLQCPDCPLQVKYPVYLLRHLLTHKKKVGERKEETKALALEKRPSETQLSSKTVKEQVFAKQVECSLCKAAFNDAQVLRKHCLTHISGSSVLECPFCKQNFSNRRNLVRHMFRHTGDKQFSCSVCGKRFYRDFHLKCHMEKFDHNFPKQVVTKHVAKHVTKQSGAKLPLNCPHCSRVFFREPRFKIHLKGHQVGYLKPCPNCGQCFIPPKLATHKKNCDRTSELKKDLSVKEDCSKTLSPTSHTVDEVPFQASAPKMLEHKCQHCTKRFKYRSLLRKHARSHTGARSHACMHCGHTYTSRAMCFQHEAFCDGVYRAEQSKVEHDGAVQQSNISGLSSAGQKQQAETDSKFKCRFCTKTFMKARNLRSHFLTHNEAKPYRCKACDSCFSRYDRLKVHENHCTGKRPRLEIRIPRISLDDVGKGWLTKHYNQPVEKQQTFECTVCSKRFTAESTLSRHIILFHVPKSFKCECGVSYSHEKSLKMHKRKKKCKKVTTKTNYSLPVKADPPKETATEQIRSMRKRILRRIQPDVVTKYQHSCSYCPRAFGNAWHLRVHTRLHTGEMPYACDYCGLRFIRKDYVQRHYAKCPKKMSQNSQALCDRCGGFFTEQELETHKKSCTLKRSSSNSANSQIQQSAAKNLGFSCAFCTSRFLLFSQLQEHFISEHKMETSLKPPVTTAPLQQHLANIPQIKNEPLDESSFEQSSDTGNIQCNLDSFLEPDTSKPLACTQCKMRFLNKAGLMGHLRVHSNEYPFSCKRCKRGFWNKNLFRNHHRKCGKDGHDFSIDSDQELATPLKADMDLVLNSSVLVFKDDLKTTGPDVLQTDLSFNDDLNDESPQQSDVNQERSSPVPEKKAVQYQCSECDQTFTDGLMLISHLEDHGREEQEKRRHTCVKCGRVCSSPGHLEKHMKVHSSDKISCPDCSKVFSTSSELERHKSCHEVGKPFQCRICHYRFSTKPSLTKHYGEDHPDDLFGCPYCEKAYALRKSLARHCKARHQKSAAQSLAERTADEKKSTEQISRTEVSESSESSEDGDSEEDGDEDSAPYFPCHVCGKTFLTSESLEDHQRCHLGEKPHECAECGKCFFQASQLQQHQRMHKSEFQCQTCGRGFVSLFALRKHKHSHGKSRPYRCSNCQLSFTGPSQLAEHMFTHSEENFPCDICNQIFFSKSSRAEHRKSHSESRSSPPTLISSQELEKSENVSGSSSIFSNELKYRCGVCSERFKDPEELSEHGCLAATERQYTCSQCDEHFLHKSHLKKHINIHHVLPSSGYPCNQCVNSFSSPQLFLSHLKNHDEFTAKIKDETEDEKKQPASVFICPVCHQCFPHASALANHIPVHSDPFECKVCQMHFTSRRKLEEHERCHVTAPARLECAMCGQKFLGAVAFHKHKCTNRQDVKVEPQHSYPSADKTPVQHNRQVGEEEDVDVTGEDLYNCPTCSVQFSSKSSLLDHQNKQHPIEFKCELCGKSFALRRYLQEHERRHRQMLAKQNTAQATESQFKDSQRPKSVDTAQEPPLHMWRHAEKEGGEYRCDMCYESFSQSSLLKRHQESHVGQVVYECTECDKAFAFPHLLEEHQQTHAGSSQ